MSTYSSEMVLKENLRALRLPTILQEHDACSRTAIENKSSYIDFLSDLTTLEVNERAVKRIKRRISEAQFPALKTLDSFEMNKAPGLSAHLLSLAAEDYPVKQVFSAIVDHYSTLKADGNPVSRDATYYEGLLVEWLAPKVDVELGVDGLSIHYNRRKIAEHRRVFGKGKWQLDPFHYLSLLARKPTAFEAARPIRQWRIEWPVSYERLLDHFRRKNALGKGTKEFIKVLMLLAEYPQELVDHAILEALQLRLSDAASRQLLLDAQQQVAGRGFEPLAIEQYPRLTGYEMAPPDLEHYGALLKGGC